MTWARNISRIAARAESGARTPIRGTTLSASTCGTVRRGSPPPRRGASTLPATTTGPFQPASTRCRAAARSGSALPPSVPPVSSTTSGRVVCLRSRVGRVLRHTTRLGDDRDDLAAAGEGDPAAGLGGRPAPRCRPRRSGGPPPALEQASTSASAARGSCATSAARHASYPSSTSVPIVVGCSARGDDPALVEVDQRGLGERRPEVDADRRSRCSPGSHQHRERGGDAGRSRRRAASRWAAGLAGSGSPARIARSTPRNRR